jgi:hypothetical protein
MGFDRHHYDGPRANEVTMAEELVSRQLVLFELKINEARCKGYGDVALPPAAAGRLLSNAEMI